MEKTAEAIVISAEFDEGEWNIIFEHSAALENAVSLLARAQQNGQKVPLEGINEIYADMSKDKAPPALSALLATACKTFNNVLKSKGEKSGIIQRITIGKEDIMLCTEVQIPMASLEKPKKEIESMQEKTEVKHIEPEKPPLQQKHLNLLKKIAADAVNASGPKHKTSARSASVVEIKIEEKTEDELRKKKEKFHPKSEPLKKTIGTRLPDENITIRQITDLLAEKFHTATDLAETTTLPRKRVLKILIALKGLGYVSSRLCEHEYTDRRFYRLIKEVPDDICKLVKAARIIREALRMEKNLSCEIKNISLTGIDENTKLNAIRLMETSKSILAAGEKIKLNMGA